MREFKGENGARIVINSAKWETVKRLRRCIATELKKVGIDIENVTSLSQLQTEFSGAKLLVIAKDLLLTLESSEEFDNILTECMRECTYSNKVIDANLFDDIEEAREDYDKIRLECLKENLNPFFKKVAGLLKNLSTATELDQV